MHPLTQDRSLARPSFLLQGYDHAVAVHFWDAVRMVEIVGAGAGERKISLNSGGVNSGGVTSGGVTSGGVTKGTEAETESDPMLLVKLMENMVNGWFEPMSVQKQVKGLLYLSIMSTEL